MPAALSERLKAQLELHKVDSAEVMKQLAGIGATDDALLKYISAQDLIGAGVSNLTARAIIEALGLNEKPVQNITVVSDDPVVRASRLKPSELVDEYDVTDPLNPYGERLKRLVKNRKCLVFNADGSFNVEGTKALVAELIEFFPERENVLVGEELLPVYRIGDRPARLVDENPFFQGEPLRPNGQSDNHVPWLELPLDVRQLVYLTSDSGETEDTNDSDAEHEMFDLCQGKKFTTIAKRFPKAAMLFQAKKETNTLPPLKVKLNPDGSASAVDDEE